MMAYPPGQSWGSVFVTVGDPVAAGRPGQDLSPCHTLKVDLRTGSDNVTLRIGMKDSSMPDDGSETTVPVTAAASWQTFSIPLGSFPGVERSKVYVPIEFVFSGEYAKTVFFRNLRFLC